MESTESSSIGIDAGGTTVDAGLVSRGNADRGSRILGNVSRVESPSEKPFEEIVKQFGDLIIHAKHNAQESGYQTKVVGIAMPGPFDYPNGISKMQHKFPAAFGKDLGHPLREAAELPVYFVNDADAFGLGVYSKLYPDEKRILAITLGTGLGSAFITDGEIAAEVDSEQDSVPNNGEIWNLPFEKSILEDYASKRAIETMYEHGSGRKLEVREIAERARQQDEEAIATFTNLGENLGRGLENVIAQFHPTRIVFGGQISKSLDLFEEPIKKIMKEKNSDIPISAAVDENYGIYGAAYYATMKAESKTS